MEANEITLKTFAVSIAAVLGVETAFRLVTAAITVFPMLALSTIRCLEAVILMAITLRFEKGPDAIGLSRSQILPGLGKGLIWSACFGIAAGVIYFVLLLVGFNALKLLNGPKPPSCKEVAAFFLAGCVIGPISEEIFFRGIIYGFFRHWGVMIAVLLSTVIFVLIHPIGGSLPLTQLVGGIIFALAYEKEQSLMVPITIHCLGNLAIFSLTYLS
ncbi:MAG: CPBP family intramembrane metalloprotease, partial [Deltaproteobacteria bacterium]|nr:CPBP family intramembrane metalloprotease [Deltaproteobacteria bacterium]